MGRKSNRGRKRPKQTDTSFTMTIVHDDMIPGKPCVLLVHNIADEVRLAKASEEARFIEIHHHYTSGIGKRAGWGLPGGGRKVEDMETPEDAARNEFRGETGFDLIDTPIKQFVQPYLFIMNDKTHKTIKAKPFEYGTTPSYKIKPGHTAVFNYVHVYTGEIKWEGSNFQKVLRKAKSDLMAQGLMSQNQINREGMYVRFDELTPEELASLNIHEKDEIDMMGIFPIEFILKAKKHANIRKDDFYFRHLERIEMILRKAKKEGISLTA